MADLQVVAVLTAKPGAESQLGDALSALVTSTRDEDGCLAYDLFKSGSDAQAFVTVERWRDQAALDAHLNGPGVQQALASAKDILAGPPAIHPLAEL